MALFALTVLSFTVLPATADAGLGTATPIQKVLEMLEDLVTTGEKKKIGEELEFDKFKSWCDETTSSKTNEIDDGESKVESLTATIEDADVKIKKLISRIEALEGDVGRWTTDLKSVGSLRDKEAEDFAATMTDYSESIDAVKNAIQVLKEKALDAPEALLQLKSARIVPMSAKKAIVAFLDSHAKFATSDPKAYNAQSGGVLDMLGELKIKFESKKNELQVQEDTAIAAYTKLKDQLTSNKEDAKSEVKSKTTLKSKEEETKATAEGDLADTKRDLEEDKKYLAEMSTHCEQKVADFKKRTDMRDEELATLKKATEIIASDVVKGSGEKHLPKLLQRAMKSPALAQLRGEVTTPFQRQAIDFLAENARRSGSRLLMQAAQSAAANPFKKVKKMIKDLIVKLMEEATTEIEQKGFCDTELATNKVTRESKTEQVASLQSDVDRLSAEIGQLTDDLSAVMSEIQELEDTMGKATMDRMKSKLDNQNTIEDAVSAQKAVDKAMSLLKDFYEKAGNAAALVQDDPKNDAPKAFKASDRSMRAKGGGVLDFLEVILSDFQRLESETAAAESQEADEYDRLMLATKKDKAMKEAAMKHKTSRKTEAESEYTTASQDLKATKKELNTALLTYEKLKPTCVGSGASYEERAQQRKEEMESLQKALEILQKGNGSL